MVTQSVCCLAMALGALLPSPAAADEVRLTYLIGLEQYQGGLGKGTFRNLPVVNDIETMSKALVKIGFASDDITVLTDGDRPIGSPLHSFGFRTAWFRLCVDAW